MRLTESILKNLKEAVPVYYEDKRERKIPTGLTDDRAKDIINAVVGQLSDGMWENSPGMGRYWKFTDGIDDKGNIIVYNGFERRDQYAGRDRYGASKYTPQWTNSAFGQMSDEEVKRYFAHKIKQIVKEEGLEWSRDNTEHSDYLDYNSGVTVRDAYRVYDRLLGRIDRITESSIPSSKDPEFKDTVLRDFRLFLMDKYDDELYKDVSEDDVNEYFTGMFYDIWDNEDLDSANKAEEIIRSEYLSKEE